MAKESNWRWNVFELGLNPLLVRLAARINSGVYTGYYATTIDNGNNQVIAWLPSIFGDVNGTTIVTGFPRNGPFPYGVPVDPD